MSLLIWLIAAFVVAFLMLRVWPDATQTLVHRISQARNVLLAVVGTSFIILFLSTGSLWYVMIGFVMAVVVFAEFLSSDSGERITRRQ